MKINPGRFTIRREWLYEDQELARAILKDVIVWRAEFGIATDGIEYQGLHPDFAEIEHKRYACLEFPHYEPMVELRQIAPHQSKAFFVGWRKA